MCFAVLTLLSSHKTQECDWTQEDRDKEQQLLNELVSIIDQRNLIISSLDRDVQRFAEAKRAGCISVDVLKVSHVLKADFSLCHQGKGRG